MQAVTSGLPCHQMRRTHLKDIIQIDVRHRGTHNIKHIAADLRGAVRELQQQGGTACGHNESNACLHCTSAGIGLFYCAAARSQGVLTQEMQPEDSKKG